MTNTGNKQTENKKNDTTISLTVCKSKNNAYRRFVDCCSVGFAPNQLSKRPIGVACNERLSTVFSALFCKVGVRAVA
jgi:hypothetical protein